MIQIKKILKKIKYTCVVPLFPITRNKPIFSLYFVKNRRQWLRNIAIKYLPLNWPINIKNIELELTSFCNLACHNCNRSIPQAPTGESMSLAQIKKFVDESLSHKWKWESIVLIGGEPTLHPDFFGILDEIYRYKKYNPKTLVELFTNGYGERVHGIIKKIPDWISVVNSNKLGNVNDFTSYNSAPIDLEKYAHANYKKACRMTTMCGIGLNRYGYYLCGVGCSIDRVFGLDIGIKSLKEVSKKQLRKQANILCRFCGHYKDTYETTTIKNQVMSKTRLAIYKKYRQKKPENTLY